MNDGDLLRCLVQVIGRIAIPVDKAREIVGTGKKRVKACNWVDGTQKLSNVAKKTKINQGNLSRAAANWVENGIAFWIGDGPEARLLHLYRIPKPERRRVDRGRA